MKQNKIIELGRVEKVLKRPNRYIGNIKPTFQEQWVFDPKKQQMDFTKIKYSSGLIKIIREVIDNSVDEFIRTKGKFATKIKITHKDGKFTIEDNGRGIPVELVEGTDRYMPESAWTILDAGSNFEDEDDAQTAGQNGEGVTLTNIFSTEFHAYTCDGSKKFSVTCHNNMSDIKTKVEISKLKKTVVSFVPDYNLFGLKSFDENHERVIYTELLNLSVSYPDISFSYNGKRIDVKNFSSYVGFFGDNYETIETDGLKIGVLPNDTDDFKFVHFINGLNVYNGGTPFNWVVNNTINPLIEKLRKKHKNIKVGDVKNKLTFIVVFDGMFKPRFEDQVKSICTNNYSDFKSQIGEIDFQKFSDKLRRNKGIVDPITELYRIREEEKRRQELKKLGNTKTKKRIKSDKYLPATKSKDYFLIVEGLSAMGGLSSEFGREKFSFYAVQGKPLNVINATHEKFMQNKELKALYETINQEPHRKILIATDQDLDGFNIRSLLFGFFYKYMPEVIKKNQVGVLQTPIIVAKNSRGKIIETFYSLRDYNTYVEKHGDDKLEYKYLKGLGSYEDGELQEIIERDGFETMVEMIEWDDKYGEIILDWLDGSRTDVRKKFILENEFDIGKV